MMKNNINLMERSIIAKHSSHEHILLVGLVVSIVFKEIIKTEIENWNMFFFQQLLWAAEE